MEQKQVIWETLEQIRRDVDRTFITELIIVGGLIIQLGNDSRFKEVIDVNEILRAEENVKEKLAETLEIIEKEIPYFQGVFRELSFLEEIDIIQTIRIFRSLRSIRNFDEINRIIDVVVRKQIALDGRTSGDINTPESINQLAISILNPKEGTVYDGTMGVGDGLIEAVRHTQNHSLKIYGQDINSRLWAISKIRLFIEGIEDCHLEFGDIFTYPAFKEGNNIKKFDFLYMNPPFSIKHKNDDIFRNDSYNRFLYGVPPKSKIDFAFISHALASMNATGKGIVVSTHGVLFRGGKEGVIRENIVESDVIEAIVSLPAHLYHSTALPVVLIVFNKNKEKSRKNRILFVEADNCFTEENRMSRYISIKDIEKISATIKEGKEVSGFSTFVNTDDLFENNLNISRYVLPNELEIDNLGNVKFDLDRINEMNMVTLNDYAEFFSGYNVGVKNRETVNGKYKIVQLADVQGGKLLFNKVKNYDIENNARIDMYRLKKDDVILSIRGTVLKSAIVNEEVDDLLLSQNFIGIRCNEQLNPDYLKAYLESPLAEFLLVSKMSGTSLPTLSRVDVENLSVPKLPIDKQKEIADYYTQTKSKIELEIERLQEELQELDLSTYHKMGIRELFEIDNE